MRCLLFALLIPLLGCDTPVAQKPTEPAPKAAPKPKEKARTGPQEYVPPPVKPKEQPLTFAEAWAEAERLGVEADKEEPEATKKAGAILTQPELIEISNGMFNPSLYLSEHAARLNALGYSAWVARQSRRAAALDDRFKGCAQVLWDQGTGARGVLVMMNTWGTIAPQTLHGVKARVSASSPTVNLSPEERDAILALGGAKWLARPR